MEVMIPLSIGLGMKPAVDEEVFSELQKTRLVETRAEFLQILEDMRSEKVTVREGNARHNGPPWGRWG